MILPIDMLDQTKELMSMLGVTWSDEKDPNHLGPVCTGWFRGEIIGIFKDDTPLGEIKCLNPINAEHFEEIFQSFFPKEVDESE